MTVRTDDAHGRTGIDPQQPPRGSEPRASENANRASDSDAIEGDDALEGDRPVLEVDTAGIAHTRHRAAVAPPTEAAEVDPLFGQDAAADFRARWDVVQRGFVDDPQQAVRAGDELVMQVIDALTRTFADQRTEFEKDPDSDQDSTETLRLALRRYRSFFERVLSI